MLHRVPEICRGSLSLQLSIDQHICVRKLPKVRGVEENQPKELEERISKVHSVLQIVPLLKITEMHH